METPMASNAAMKAWRSAGQPGKQQTDPSFDVWVDQWFNNAKKAGVYNPDGSPRGEMAERDVGSTTDETGMRQYARQHGMSEDYARFDDATLQLWEQYKDPNCPPNYPYQSLNGTGCAEKPIDSGLNSPGKQKRAQQQQGGQQAPQQGFMQQPMAPQDTLAQHAMNPFQRNLLQLFNQQGGIFQPQSSGGLAQGQGGALGRSLTSGGIWWADPAQQANAPEAPQPVAPIMQAPKQRRGNVLAPIQPRASAPPPVAGPTVPGQSPLTQNLLPTYGGGRPQVRSVNLFHK